MHLIFITLSGHLDFYIETGNYEETGYEPKSKRSPDTERRPEEDQKDCRRHEKIADPEKSGINEVSLKVVSRMPSRVFRIYPVAQVLDGIVHVDFDINARFAAHPSQKSSARPDI